MLPAVSWQGRGRLSLPGRLLEHPLDLGLHCRARLVKRLFSIEFPELRHLALISKGEVRGVGCNLAVRCKPGGDVGLLHPSLLCQDPFDLVLELPRQGLNRLLLPELPSLRNDGSILAANSWSRAAGLHTNKTADNTNSSRHWCKSAQLSPNTLQPCGRLGVGVGHGTDVATAAAVQAEIIPLGE